MPAAIHLIENAAPTQSNAHGAKIIRIDLADIGERTLGNRNLRAFQTQKVVSAFAAERKAIGHADGYNTGQGSHTFEQRVEKSRLLLEFGVTVVRQAQIDRDHALRLESPVDVQQI